MAAADSEQEGAGDANQRGQVVEKERQEAPVHRGCCALSVLTYRGASGGLCDWPGAHVKSPPFSPMTGLSLPQKGAPIDLSSLPGFVQSDWYGILVVFLLLCSS